MRRFYPCVLFVVFLVSLAIAQEPNKPAVQPPAAASSSTADNTTIDENPVTVKTTSDVGTKKPADTDPVFGVPPLPQGKTMLSTLRQLWGA